MLLSALFVLAAAPVAVPSPYQTGVLTPPLIGTPSEAALAFANSRKAELGLDARTTLISSGAFSTRFGGSVHLQQSVNGLPIFGRKVVVTFDTAQRVVRVSNSMSTLGAAKLDTSLSLHDAIALASPEIEGAWLRTDGQPWGAAKKMVFVVNGELHIGFLVFIPTLKNSENWHVAIDGTDGSVLWTENRAWHANDAQVYPSSPGGLQGGVGVAQTMGVMLEHLKPDAGGYLVGDRIRALNSCPTAGCVPDAGPARVQGQQQTFQGPIDFDVAICDQQRRVTNDPLVHPSGNYVYAPVDPPGTAAISVNNAADWDEFAEVHGYYHVSKAYEAVRTLSVGPLARDGGFSPFVMRDTGANGDVPTVWVNVCDPDFAAAMDNGMGVYVSNSLARTDNAMYLARENMDLILLPPQVINGDALVIYQGTAADFAYDGPVLWHEFGHGAIHSTSDWQTVVTFDQRSSNNESSALHEGVSDLIAAMTGKRSIVGEYVGPRISPGTTSIRDVANTERCPDVLWGESHQDSLHFTGAVWEARQQFLGTDNGDTFDAAFYAAMVSFPPDVGFTSAAQIITDTIVAAFPGDAMARTKLTTIFDARGVTNCSKVLDVTNSLQVPRTYFNIPGTQFAGVADNLVVPGPYQFKIRVPRGAKSVSMQAQMQSFGGGGNSRLEFLAAADRPIAFAKNGTNIANDATARVVPTSSMGVVSAVLPIAVPCGGELNFALGGTSRRDRTLFNLTFAFEQADSCPEVDAGVPDAGMMQMPMTVRLVSVKEELGPRTEGCSCTTASPFALVVGALWLLRRRRQSRS
ncbi:MAG: hypothetical protein JNM17_04785 [Archangium sp.]|nr:hypothetical protein [Archangium sp.]